MNINVRAKFKDESIANDVIEEVKKNIELNETKLISKKTMQKYIRNYYEKRLKSGLIWSASIGSVIGCFIGLGIHFTAATTVAGFTVSSYSLILFMVVGLLIGVIFSLTFFYIRREKIPTLSVYDIKENQAIVIFNISSNKLNGLKRILNSKNVIKYHVT